jgi:hypothetical protein
MFALYFYTFALQKFVVGTVPVEYRYLHVCTVGVVEWMERRKFACCACSCARQVKVGHCHDRDGMVAKVTDLDLDVALLTFLFRKDRVASHSGARSEIARAPARSRRTRVKSRS